MNRSYFLTRNNKLSKIFNKNTTKVRYSYRPNMKQTVSNNNNLSLQIHRKRNHPKMKNYIITAGKKCCCPFNGKCLTKCVVYKATVTETYINKQETYTRLTENEFKVRFNLHKLSLNLEHKRTATTLNNHVWKLKMENHRFQHQMGH